MKFLAMSEEQFLELANYYYENDAKRIKKLVNNIIKRFGGISECDYDDFYSDSYKAFSIACEKWNGKDKFESFLQHIVKRTVQKRMDYFNAKKRKQYLNGEYVHNLSLDAKIDGESVSTYLEKLPSAFDLHDEANTSNELFANENYNNFYEHLTVRQKQVVEMIVGGFSPGEIKETLKITDGQYASLLSDLRSYEKMKYLLISTEVSKYKEEEKMVVNSESKAKHRNTQYTIESLIKKHKRYEHRYDYPGQRSSDQWDFVTRSNLMSDVIQGNAIPEITLAEQVKGKIVIIWIIDGKQRCTTFIEYVSGGFAISRNVDRYNIEYRTTKKDENGNIVFDSNGDPIYEQQICDIRGKKFKDLPEELQDRIRDYPVPTCEHLNCTSEDMMYHIKRYNGGKAMNPAQKGITGLSETYATAVKAITQLPFFTEHDNYTRAVRKNGTLEKMVMETAMATDFLEDWKKSPEQIGRYLKANAESTHFEKLQENIEVIEEILTEDIRKMFTVKDSFIWLSIFAKFRETGEDNKRFVEFMTEFVQSLHSKELNGITFDELAENRRTKDKPVVTQKINHIEKLMNEFLFGETEKMERVFETAEIDEAEQEEISYKMPFEASKDSGNEEVIVSKEMIEEIKKCELFSSITPEDARKVIINTALLFNGDSELNTEDISESIDFACNCFDDYSVEIPVDSPVYAAENLPGAIYIIALAIQRDVADSIINKWMKRIHEICSDARTAGSFVDRAEMFKARFDRFVEVKSVA